MWCLVECVGVVVGRGVRRGWWMWMWVGCGVCVVNAICGSTYATECLL